MRGSLSLVFFIRSAPIWSLSYTHQDNRITSYRMKKGEKWHFSLDERKREMSSLSERLCWYPWGYTPYMDSRVLEGTWVYKDMSVVMRYLWSWLATVLDFSFHHLTLFYISFCWLCYRFAGRLYPPEFSIPALGCGIRFHFLPHALWNFCGFSYPAEYISTVCDCISYCI